MASILLINDNKIVSRLLQLSSDKNGYSMEEKISLEPSQGYYDIILIDSDKYSPKLVSDIKEQLTFQKLGYIGIKNEPVGENFDMRLDKPFLPSDFVALVEQNLPQESPTTDNVSDTLEEDELLLDDISLENEASSSFDDIISETEQEHSGFNDKELDELDELEELELDELPSLEEDADKDETMDLALDSSTVMSTGVAEQFMENKDENSEHEDLEHEDLANIISEIEEEHDLPKELDLSTESELDENILEDTHEFTEVLEDENTESLEETKAVLDNESTNDVEETESLEKSEEEIANEKAVDEAIAIAMGTATTATTIMPEDKKETEKSPDKIQTTTEEIEELEDQRKDLDKLEGIEDIEKESDYITNEETQDNEFSSLNEEDVQKVMSGDTIKSTNIDDIKQDTTIPKEEILKEEITTEGQESMVESNDVQQWIRDAVAKAITPEMIKEALNDMQINVTLDFTKKDA